MYSRQVEPPPPPSATPGRKPLTPALIVDRALSLADAEGLDAVTIRRLAQELGVTPMALYWHFRNKDSLLDAMVDRFYAELDLAIDDGAAWQEQLRALLNALVTALAAHPTAASLLPTRTRTALSESSLHATEVALEILRRAGFAPAAAAHVIRITVSMAAGVVADAARLGRLTPASDADTEEKARALLAEQPRDRYPRLIEALGPMNASGDPVAYRALGVELLLAGIERMAARSTTATVANKRD